MVQFRPPTGSIPDAPGSYQFVDAEGRVLYVGKAKSLRHRLPNYWQDPHGLPPRTAQMVAAADHVEWVVVGTEVEALILEHSLIQTHQPRFNVRLKDDKSYPWLAVTVGEEWPRPMVFRGRKRKGVRYFGPYGHVGALRDTLDLLLRSFPVRTCSEAKFKRHARLGRPCLLYDIERCSGPCVGAIDQDRYRGMVDDLMRFLDGDNRPVMDRLAAEMAEAADALEFERAARLRDRLTAVRKAAETQQMVSERPEDFDVVGLATDDLEAAVQVFHVRRGRVVGRGGFVADKVEDLTTPQMLDRVVEQLYGAAGAEVPRRVLVPAAPESADVLGVWLGGLRGGPVDLAVPQRGAKRALQELVARNAAEDLARHRMRRAADHNSRSKALTELQAALGLPEAPLRIECYDMSHLQGTDYVGSMVVFEDGLAKKSDYRRFKVKTVAGNDDYAAMEEVLTRRLTALLDERAARAAEGAGPAEPVADSGGGAGRPPVADDGEEPRSRRATLGRFAYAPQLLLIDGGKGQLAVGERVVASLGLTGQIQLAALAKQFEEVYRPGSADPVRIPRGSEALYLLQRVRDEAHRFAVTFHRQRRGNRMTASVLDGVPGLGPTRRTRLVKEMGGVKALRAASAEELRALPWLPDRVADGVYAQLHGTARR
ncbi:MAG TPA: excinuclease ABC subunit UvrC [Acidimicrobiales bacterium]|nr:excinuclease ABC subunit UvrC [Acidimicrobiales bacterium]